MRSVVAIAIMSVLSREKGQAGGKKKQVYG